MYEYGKYNTITLKIVLSFYFLLQALERAGVCPHVIAVNETEADENTSKQNIGFRTLQYCNISVLSIPQI